MTFVEIGSQFESVLPTVQLLVADLLDLGVRAVNHGRGFCGDGNRVQIVDDLELIFEVQAVDAVFRNGGYGVEPVNGGLGLGTVGRRIDGGGEHIR